MSKEQEVNVEMGLCTKEMAKENPIKEFEILIEEYKQKWSKQMYDYFKECLNEIKKNKQALEIIKESIPIEGEDFFYDSEFDTYLFLGNKVSKEEFELLKEVLK